MSDIDLEERARRRKELREQRERELEEELRRWEEERKKRIEERRRRRAEIEAGVASVTSTNASTSDLVASQNNSSAQSSDSIALNRRNTKQQIEQELAAWEEERKIRLAEKAREAEERKRQLEEIIRKEEEERQKRLEQRRKEREEQRRREAEEEERRKKEFEERRLRRQREYEEMVKKIEEERQQRQLSRLKLLQQNDTATNTEQEKQEENKNQASEQAVSDKQPSKTYQPEPTVSEPPTEATPSTKKHSTTDRPVPSVPPPIFERLTLEQVFCLKDSSSGVSKPDPQLLKKHFKGEGRLTREACREILLQTKDIVSKEPNVVTVDAPVNVIGDLHGQFYDLIHLIENAGEPGRDKNYVFLGDYVDRGTFSCEICLYLFAAKINYPARITLLRGNHETRAMAMTHNFYAEAKTKYGEDLYELFQEVFDALPLAAIIETKEMGRLFCCHGGLSPSFKTIEDINNIDRFQEPPDDGGLCDILWSDPADTNALNQNFTRNREREVSWVYGYNPLIDFLEENNLTMIVRAHQVKELGYEEHKYNQAPPDRKYPLVITIFSAPNYCDSYQNTGAYLEVVDDEYRFHQFTWQEHPYCFNNFINAFTFSLPFVIENLMKFILDIQEVVDAQEDKEDDLESEKQFEEKIKKAGRALLLLQRWRQENVAKLKRLGESKEEAERRSSIRSKFAGLVRKAMAEKSRFLAAKEADVENEKLKLTPELKNKIEIVRRKSRSSLLAFEIPPPS